MILKVQSNNLFVGMAPDLIDKGVAVLQYADDTVICLSHDREKAINLKLLLYLFEMMSGLKINYLKSEIFVIGADNSVADFYSELFGCGVATLPMKYLGVPVTFSALKTLDWEFLVGKMIK